MKSFKFLAALAIPAMFAACTSEELYTNGNDASQKMEEAVGANLVGTDVSLDFFKGIDIESRKATDGSWHATDLIGLGWLVNGSIDSEQSIDKMPSNSKLYNNLQFFWDESKNDGNGAFTARGNIYRGWYFSYYPWEYKGDFSVKTVTVNPEQVSSNPNDRMSQLLHLSCLQFIGEDDIDETTGALDKPFKNIPVLNVLAVKTSAEKGSRFEKEIGELAGCEIENVTISAEGKNIFSEETLTIRAAKLPVYDQSLVTKKADGNDKALYDVLYKSGDDAGLVINYTDNVTTSVKDGVYTAADDARIYTLLVPATAEMDVEDVTINVKIDCGDFLIEYKEDAEEGTADDKNNKAIQAIVDMYKADGALTAYNASVQSVDVVLHDGIFIPDFANVNQDNWNAKVQLAETLGLEDVTFTLAKDADIVLSSKIKLPADGVTVKGISGNDFSVEKSYTWKEGLKLGDSKISIMVNEGAKLTIDKNVDLSSAKKLTNNGEITAKAGAVIGKDGKNVLTNNNTVYVEYGAYVYPYGEANVIAYKVPKKYNLSQIKDLITTGTAGSANVNTLVVGDGVELNCVVSTVVEGEEADNNPYNPSAGTPDSSDKDVLELTNLDLQINGTGKVSAPEGYSYAVKNVKMNGGMLIGIDVEENAVLKGESNIEGAEVKGNVTVEAGTANLNAVTIEGQLNIEAGATTKLSNSVTAIKINEIVNNGTLISSNDINVTNITLDGSTTTLESEEGLKDKVIWYTGTYTQNGGYTLNGRILKYEASEVAAALNNVKKGEIVKINSDVEFTNWSNLNPANVDYVLDLNGNTLDITGEIDNMYGGEKFEKAMTIKNGVMKDQLRLNGNVTFENVTFKMDYLTNPNGPAIYWTGGNVTFKNCKFETEVGRHLEGAGGVNGTLTLENCYFEAQTAAIPYINPLGAKGKVIMTGNTFEANIAFDGLYGNEKKYSVTGNTFEGVLGTNAPESNFSATFKTFCNSVIDENTFVGVNKIEVTNGFVNNKF